MTGANSTTLPRAIFPVRIVPSHWLEHQEFRAMVDEICMTRSLSGRLADKVPVPFLGEGMAATPSPCQTTLRARLDETYAYVEIVDKSDKTGYL